MQHLDVAGGTGDIAFRVLQRMREAEAETGATAPEQQVNV
jgi:ubiquinone/menaquinone biosynthesis C-methylase UbiE